MVEEIKINNEDDISAFAGLMTLSRKGNSIKYSKDEITTDYYFDNLILMRAINDIIESLKNNINIEDAIIDAGANNKIESNSLKEILLDEEYLIDESTQEAWLLKAESLNPKQLKKLCKKHKLKKSGSKKEIIQRLIDNVPLNKLNDGDTVSLSPKGQKLYDTEECIDFLLFLSNFYYNEFEEYRKDKNKDTYDLFLDFLDEHFKLANSRKDHLAYIDTCRSKALIYLVMEEYEEAAKWILKKQILELNPVYLNKEYYDIYNGIEELTKDIMLTLYDEIGEEEVKKIHDKVFDNLEYQPLAPKDETWQLIDDLTLAIFIEDAENKLNTFKEKYWV